jgi:hypothetical protein
VADQFDSRTTYGPAQERYSKIAINFRKLPKGQAGEFQNKPDLQTLLSAPSRVFSQTPQLVVDPNNTDISGDLGVTLRHEAIHGLLDKLGLAGRQAAADQPSYVDVSNALFQNRRAGMFSQEAPAYTLSNDKSLAMDPHLRMAFAHGFLQTLNGLDPKVAATIRSMPGNQETPQ